MLGLCCAKNAILQATVGVWEMPESLQVRNEKTKKSEEMIWGGPLAVDVIKKRCFARKNDDVKPNR